jgi:hypothetical protein
VTGKNSGEILSSPAGELGLRRPGRACAAAGAVLLAVLVVLSGCSRSGALSGDMVVRTPSGEVARGARVSVFLVISSEAFEGEWGRALSAFREEVAPAAEAQKAAEYKAAEARLAWDRALAARGKSGWRRGPWTLSLRDASTAGSQERWNAVRATDNLVFQARKRVWDIVRKHEEHTHVLVQKHATQRVQTDETGHFVIVNVPAGKAYVYARWQEGHADFLWFVPIEIQGGTQSADLTQDNQRRWPLLP